MNKIPVIEMFGPTIQGEGAVIGLKTMFVRTYGCDYRCRWCDSAFTWDGSAKEQVRQLVPEEIIKELQELGMDNCEYVTLSGGNPALYGEPVTALIHQLHRLGKKVAVETQGSRWQDWFTQVDVLTISPKPPSSEMETDLEILDGILSRIDALQTNLKVVVFSDEDYEFAKKIYARYPSFPLYLQAGNEDVYEAGDISHRLLQKLAWLFDKVIADPGMQRARVLPQLHALIWHNKRGK